jgi:toxin HigB-1
MIESFRHKGLKRLYEDDDRSAAVTIEAVDQPTFRLHPLKGDLKGFWAVTVRSNWRVIFRLKDGGVFDVDFIDYH